MPSDTEPLIVSNGIGILDQERTRATTRPPRSRPDARALSTEKRAPPAGAECFSPRASKICPLGGMRKHTDQPSVAVANDRELSRPLDDDVLLTDAEVSVMLGNVPRSTLRAWRTRGFGPRVIRLAPRTPRYRLGDVRAWIASRAAGAQP